MSEIEIYHLANGKDIFKGRYINRAVLNFNNQFYIGKHWIYFFYHLNSIDTFLDQSLIKIGSKNNIYNGVIELKDLIDEYYSKKLKNLNKIKKIDPIIEVILLKNQIKLIEYNIFYSNDSLMRKNLEIFDRIHCMKNDQSIYQSTLNSLKTPIGSIINKNKEFNKSFFRKPKKIEKVEQLDKRINTYWKKSKDFRMGMFYETLLDWYCHTITNFCLKEYITKNLEKYIFTRI